jgi:hypothetical protein
MDHDEWKQLVESQRQRKAAMVVPATDHLDRSHLDRSHLDRSREPPLTKPGDVGWVMATATVQALIEHGVFTDVILSRIGELMLAVAETRSLEGRGADAEAIERAVSLFAEGAATIPRPVR